VTDEAPETIFVQVLPTDLWPTYEGIDQFSPEDLDEQRLFDQARAYDVLHQRAVPQPYRNAFQMPAEALDWARQGQDTDLLLWGYVGTGKTHAAVAAGTLRTGLHRGNFRFISATKALRGLKNFHDRDEQETMRGDLTRPTVLILDDIGREKFTDADVALVTELLDDRKADGKVTIFTTNVLPWGFDQQFGAPMTSRLEGGSFMVQVAGRDRRKNP
jgi:DNA replication protein DnaC